MSIDAAFENVAANLQPGLTIWRIEDFQVVPISQDDFGCFYRGDSYIVLAVTKDENEKISSSIHFWLGSESTQDEKGVAARKTVELDDALHGAAMQYRETEGHESREFLSLFKPYGGIEILDGGIDSGFNHVEPDQYTTRLLHVKGKRDVRTRQVALSASSLNNGDVFILDKGLQLFLWMGAEANRYERAKGVEVLQRIYNSRGARPQQIVVNDEPDNEEFWSTLGGSMSDVQPATDDELTTEQFGEVKLYRVSDADGELKVEEVPKQNGKLTRNMLDTNDSFILDSGAEIFAWIGKNATAQEKKNAMSHATQFIETHNRPSWCQVVRVVENAEPPIFKSLFFQWEPAPSFDFTHRSQGIAQNIEQQEIDASQLHKRAPAENETMVDDGSGTVKVWIIEGNEMSEYPEEKYGQFFGGDSYVIQYTYKQNNSTAHLLYFWLGRHSDAIEQGSAAARVVELSNTISEPCTHVRLVQGKEPPHFCAIFKGTMIVHSGGRNGEQSNEDEARLYHVKGSDSLDTKAVQIPVSAENLNSGDCFVVVHPDGNVNLWEGKGSNEEEQTTAKVVAEILKGDEGSVTEIQEGNESEEFWSALGGQAEYPEAIPAQGAPQLPRLFHVSDKTGTLRVEEITNFAQDDLMDDDVMILDTYTQVFVWIGSEANSNERDGAMKIASEYIESADDGRDPDTPIILVNSGEEPSMFTCNFTGWDVNQAAKFVDPYEQRMHELRQEQERRQQQDAALQAEREKKRAEAIAQMEAEQQQAPAESAADEELNEPVQPSQPAVNEAILGFENKIPVQELVDARPGGEYELLWTNKEKYLSDGDFEAVFKMGPAEFEKLPTWKKTQLKKSAGLF